MSFWGSISNTWLDDAPVSALQENPRPSLEGSALAPPHPPHCPWDSDMLSHGVSCCWGKRACSRGPAGPKNMPRARQGACAGLRQVLSEAGGAECEAGDEGVYRKGRTLLENRI